MAKFCTDCGTAIEEGEKFCSVCGKATDVMPPTAPVCLKCGTAAEAGERFCAACGASIVVDQTLAQCAPVQQARQQSIQPPYAGDAEIGVPRVDGTVAPTSTKHKKKKKKTPFIIVGGALAAAALVAVLVFTDVFGLLGKTDNNKNENIKVSGDTITVDGKNYVIKEDGSVDGLGIPYIVKLDGIDYVLSEEGEYLHTDKNGIEWILVDLFGEDTGSIFDWMTASELYDALYGEEYVDGVSVEYEPEHPLLGYSIYDPVETDSQPDVTDDGDDNDDNDSGNNENAKWADLPTLDMTVWPSEYMPEWAPKYPDGDITAYAAPLEISVDIENTSRKSYDTYKQALKNGGWTIFDYDTDYGSASKDNWVINFDIYIENNGNDKAFVSLSIFYDKDWSGS